MKISEGLNLYSHHQEQVITLLLYMTNLFIPNCVAQEHWTSYWRCVMQQIMRSNFTSTNYHIQNNKTESRPGIGWGATQSEARLLCIVYPQCTGVWRHWAPYLTLKYKILTHFLDVSVMNRTHYIILRYVNRIDSVSTR